MKKLTNLILLFLFFLPLISNSQTLYFDEEGIRLSLEIKNTGQSVNCENDWDKNYSDKPLHIWKVTLSFRNGSDKIVVPKLVGIASINVIPSDGKVLNYCGYRTKLELPTKAGYSGQNLFGFIIYDDQLKNLEAGETVSYSTHLYLYAGVKPILEGVRFPGYKFLDGSPSPKGTVYGQTEQAREIKFKAINSSSTKEEDDSSVTEEYINSEIKDNIRSIANIAIDSSIVDLKAIENAVEQNPNYYDELTSCMESGNAKYYRDKLENVSSSNLKAMQAYSQLSIFYSYQCECEIGSTRPEQLVKDINQLVTTFNNSTRNSTFAPLKRVYQCKKIESNSGLESNSSIENQSNSDAIKKVVTEMKLRDDEVEAVNIISTSKNTKEALARLKERNIQKLNSYTLDALNKLTNEIPNFPLTGSEIQTLINGGSFKDVLKNYNLRASNKLAQNLGLDYHQTQALNIITTSENKKEMIERLKQNNIQQISQITADGLQKMLGDSYGSLPISSGDISNLLNGNFEETITTMKYNQDINSISNLTGGDRELASGLYDIASAIGSELNRPKTPEELKQIFANKLTLNRFVDYNTSESESITMSTYGETRNVSYYKHVKHNNDNSYSGIRNVYKTETYNLNGKLLSQTIYKSKKEYIFNDFIKNIKTKTILHDNGQVLIVANMLTGEIIIDNTKK